MTQTVRFEIASDRIATITIDVPGKSVNTLTKQVWADLDRAIEEAARHELRGVIVVSGKPKSFIAGADLFEMRAMSDLELHKYLEDGQRILSRLEKLPCPTVAAINGDALGGGLEVALACRFRVAADDPAIKIGLPETTLGLVPGWGGTVRLPRLIGLEPSLPLMTAGKPLSPADATKLGLADALAPRETLTTAAKQLITSDAKPRGADPPADLDRVFATASEKLDPNYPAPARLIKIVRDSYEKGIDAGLAGERKGLVELRSTDAGRNLMRAFFLRSGAKKAAAEQAPGEPYPVNSVAVFGGGTMGSGIAYTLLRAGYPVRVIEANADLALKARDRVAKLIDDDIAAGRLAASRNPSTQFTATGSWELTDQIDLVIEAIVEDMDAKRELFNRLDQLAKPQAVLATNTSSLSVTQLAESTQHPNRVIGVHFFNPVPRMPLVEVVSTKHSDPRAVATGVAIAVKCGKTPIVVGDGPGFIVNRVLMPYLAEAMQMAGEGIAIPAIDAAMKKWGMPMGPFALLDQIGLDVIVGIFNAMREPLAGRVVLPPLVESAVKSGMLGRKNGKGFFSYENDKKSPPVLNDELVLAPHPAPVPGDEVIQRRLMQSMRDEAKMLLREGVASSADAIDLAALAGLGIAPFRGGIVQA
jgi:3-hydroxyacyl-CoA dehydrogenase/enoyl-CoA hydratase/3-hydroxybutyryl-CoA epimerase